jgi:predicted NAD-dependent protein-ADP-ribosyltransferase YbiA (DUF1768 family)
MEVGVPSDPMARSRSAAILFYSKSADATCKHISNFTLLTRPLVITPDGGETLRGMVFPSVEHAFQASKIVHSGGTVEHVRRMLAGATEPLTPQQCKRLGGKGGFKSMGLRLDVDTWGDRSVEVMELLLACRARVDGRFADLIAANRRMGKWHAHFERSGGKSFWGGSFARETGRWKGQNVLGRMVDALGDTLVAHV